MASEAVLPNTGLPVPTRDGLYECKHSFFVDKACSKEEELLVVIRFGISDHPDALRQDDILRRIQAKVSNFAIIWTCDIEEVPDFNTMYELYDPTCLMFFYRNKLIKADFGTGNNNKMNFVVGDKQEMIDIIEMIYRAARKGSGQANIIHVKDYSTRHRY